MLTSPLSRGHFAEHYADTDQNQRDWTIMDWEVFRETCLNR